MRIAALALALAAPAAAQGARFVPPPGTCLLPQAFFLPLLEALQDFGVLPEGAAAACAEIEALGRDERPNGLEAPVAVLARLGLAATGADPDRAAAVIPRLRADVPAEARTLLGDQAQAGEARFLLDDPRSQERVPFAVFPRDGGVGWGIVLDAAHPAPLAPALALLEALAAAHRSR